MPSAASLTHRSAAEEERALLHAALDQLLVLGAAALLLLAAMLRLRAELRAGAAAVDVVWLAAFVGPALAMVAVMLFDADVWAFRAAGLAVGISAAALALQVSGLGLLGPIDVLGAPARVAEYVLLGLATLLALGEAADAARRAPEPHA